MNIIFILAPFSLLLGLAAVGAFVWSLRAGQYEDIEGSAARAGKPMESDRRERPLTGKKSANRTDKPGRRSAAPSARADKPTETGRRERPSTGKKPTFQAAKAGRKPAAAATRAGKRPLSKSAKPSQKLKFGAKSPKKRG